MCVNYLPVSAEQLNRHFEMALEGEWADEVWQDHAAPIILRTPHGVVATLAGYGMVPRRHQPAGQRAYSTQNARLETVADRPSYRGPWQYAQFCLVPMLGFFEPRYDLRGRSERWLIRRNDHAPFAVAGLWRSWREADGRTSHAFTQLTLNADQHPLMRQFHPPEDEKRSLVIVSPDHYSAWLHCRQPDAALPLLKPFDPSDWTAEPRPRPSAKAARMESLF